MQPTNRPMPDPIVGTVEADRANRKAPRPVHKVLDRILRGNVATLARDSRESGDAGIIAVPGPDGRTVRYIVTAVPLRERKRSRSGLTETLAGAGFGFPVKADSYAHRGRENMTDKATPGNGGSWYGWVQAAAGVILLGGTSRHVSARFETREQVREWLQTILDTNCAAGRIPGEWGTTWTPFPPEIRADETV